MSKTFDEELEYIIAQGCWDFVNHVTGKNSREKVVNDMAKDIKALIAQERRKTKIEELENFRAFVSYNPEDNFTLDQLNYRIAELKEDKE